MKKYLLLGLGLCLLSVSAGATNVKYKTRLQNMDAQVVLNGISFEKGENRFVDFEKNSPGLGYEIAYYSDPQTHCTTSFYVYDQNPVGLKINDQSGEVNIIPAENQNASIDWENVPVETARAYSMISLINSDLKPKAPDSQKVIEDAIVFHVKKQEKNKTVGTTAKAPVSVLTGSTSGKTMGVGVTVNEGNFLKVRMTCYPTVSEEKMTKAIAEGAKWLRRQLSDSK